MAKKSNFTEQKCPYCGGISRSQFHPTDYCYHCGKYIGYKPLDYKTAKMGAVIFIGLLIVIIAIIAVIGYFLITWIF